jgi:hypothetical protein
MTAREPLHVRYMRYFVEEVVEQWVHELMMDEMIMLAILSNTDVQRVP